jgi:hypothetical protein
VIEEIAKFSQTLQKKVSLQKKKFPLIVVSLRFIHSLPLLQLLSGRYWEALTDGDTSLIYTWGKGHPVAHPS